MASPEFRALLRLLSSKRTCPGLALVVGPGHVLFSGDCCSRCVFDRGWVRRRSRPRSAAECSRLRGRISPRLPRCAPGARSRSDELRFRRLPVWVRLDPLGMEATRSQRSSRLRSPLRAWLLHSEPVRARSDALRPSREAVRARARARKRTAQPEHRAALAHSRTLRPWQATYNVSARS